MELLHPYVDREARADRSCYLSHQTTANPSCWRTGPRCWRSSATLCCLTAISRLQQTCRPVDLYRARTTSRATNSARSAPTVFRLAPIKSAASRTRLLVFHNAHETTRSWVA